MKPQIPKLLLILKEACQKYGYIWQLVDKYSNNLVEISDGKKSFFASNSKTGAYPLNSAFSAGLANDKAWSYKLLKQRGYKIPKGDYFFLREQYRELRGDGKEIGDGYQYAEKLGYPVFVKPNNSSLGLFAEAIENRKELKKHLKDIVENSWIALIQEKINLPEYRIFVLDGKIQFAYQKVPAKIIGDGKKTIAVLIEDINKGIERDGQKITPKSLFLKNQFKKQKLNLKTVLKAGQELNIIGKANVSAGGKILNYTEIVSPKTKAWAKKLTLDFGLRVCGIDVFAKNGLDDPDGFIVIELNNNPGLVGIYDYGKKEKVMEIWGKILDQYFKNK